MLNLIGMGIGGKWGRELNDMWAEGKDGTGWLIILGSLVCLAKILLALSLLVVF